MQVALIALASLAAVFAAPTVPDLEELGDWGPWSDCTVDCGGGMMSRQIDCTDLGTGAVVSPCKQTQANCNSFPCSNDPKYVFWNEWSDCDAKCGGGLRSRSGNTQTNDDIRQEINCQAQSCTPLDPHEECGVANLVFVLDSSQSVGELNWYVVKQFVIDVISKLTIGPEQTHVGLVIYASDVQAVIPLDMLMNAEDLKAHVWQLPYMAGATNTGEAIRAMRTMMAAGRRQDVKDIAFVLSDGKTNIVPNIVQSEAQLAKDEGITIFSIAVTEEIDEAEMIGIASEPSEKYYSYVSNFEDLEGIIDDIVAGACEVTNVLVCGAWSEWSECPVSCGGPSVQISTKVCQLVDSTGKVIVEKIVREKTQECGADACPPPEPVEPPKPVEPVIDCSTCDYGPYGKVQYLPDPLNCNCFYQCERIPATDGAYTYIPHHHCCAPTLFWRNSWLTCVTDSFKETENCIEQAIVDVTTPEPATTPEIVCALQIVPGKPGYFLNGGIEQTCGINMVFDFKLCTCIPASDSEAICDSDALLYYPFDEDLNDHSCTRAVSTQTSKASVVLTQDVDRGTVAKFDGASSLHVGFIYNYFADRYVKQWSMAVWVKRTGNTKGIGGVVNNGDCVEAPSFDIHVGSGEMASCAVDTDAVSAQVVIQDVAITANVWEHVAMVYDGQSLTMYKNASPAANVTIQGNIENRQCAMNIGAQHAGTDYFQGLMDDIYIYERVLSVEEITTLTKL